MVNGENDQRQNETFGILRRQVNFSEQLTKCQAGNLAIGGIRA